ncbi:MAG: amidohydrolase [Actinomycetota bacterium]|nr:amidohydrolase [Actinomycetota bacterium]
MTTTLFSARTMRTASGIKGDAILVEDGRVVALGNRHHLSGGVNVVDFPGAVLLPGLRDAHLHPVAYAAALRGATLAAAGDFNDVARHIRDTAATTSPAAPVIGMRLNEETLTERRLPDRAVLDAAVSDRTVLVHRYCGHVAIANTAALAAAGIDAASPDPHGGLIDRDGEGNPTGVLRETAIELVSEGLGGGNQVSPDEFLSGLNRLAGLGLTSIGAILRSGAGAWASLGNEVDIAVAAADRIPINVGVYVIEDDPEVVAITRNRIHDAGGRMRWLGIKRFGDGSFGGHTAAMHEPFTDRDTIGTLRIGDIDRRVAEASLAQSGSVAIHAIGDHACSAVIDLYTDLIADGADPRRLRIEHASVLTRNDIQRLGELGIVAAVQPPFMASESAWLVNRIGEERLQRTYPFADMEAAGTVLAGSSDCPVEPPDPWAGMALARDRSGLPKGQALSPERALAMYTTGGAIALDETEPLTAGSPADFIVVDRDPVAASPDELRATEVLATYVDGVELEVDRSQPFWQD